jgi:hypothetical protein
LTVFEKIKITDPWIDAKLNSMTYKKKVFQYFELFQALLAYKFAKTDNMTPTKFVPNIFNMDIKICRI